MDRDHYVRLQEECAENPGLFHGNVAKRQICWHLPEYNAWAFFDDVQNAWSGWDAATGEAVTLDLPESFEPWERASLALV